MAWHDETTARRLESLVTLHEMLQESGWDTQELRWLERLAIAHVGVLLENGFHSTGTNHGMFQDRALLAWAFNPMATTSDQALAARAYEVATRRLNDYFEGIFSDDGVHLEHSPAYHRIVMEYMRRIVDAYRADGHDDVVAPIAAILDGAGHYATHVLQPDGRMPEIADTSSAGAEPVAGLVDTDAYRYAVTAGAQGTPPVGVDTFYPDADTAIMRDGWGRGGQGTYLHFAAAYHVDYHKHPDDLSLWLYHDGELITEAGMNGYQYDDPFTAYGYSAQAHNTVLVDGRGVNRVDGRYDQVRMTRATSDGTVSVVAGTTSRFPDPSTVWDRNVRYDRAAATVQVTDRVDARPGADATVLWHTAPGVDAAATNRQVLLYRDGVLAARLRVAAGGGSLPLQIIKGQTEPVLGWRLGHTNAPQPTEALRFQTRADQTIVTTIELLRAPAVVDIATVCPDEAGSFSDVAGVHASAIACLYGRGIAHGVGDGTRFSPHADVRRDQMASLLTRTLDHAGVPLPDGAASRTPDVPDSNVHADAIRTLTAAGVVTGDSGGNYLPGRPITRAQVASMLDRAAAAAGRPLPDGDPWFADVGGTHADSIDRLTAAGITGGDGVDGYGAGKPVTRAQMATFLARLLTHLG